MIFTSRSFAVGQAHFQIAGGWRSLGLLAMTYVAVAASLLGIIFYNAPTPIPPNLLLELYLFVVIVQGFVLLVFGSIRVGGGIRTDIISNMIESHRLMPVSSWRALLGYLFGPNAHVLAITLLNVALLIVLKLQMHLPLSDFLVNQLVLGVFALFVWSFAAMGALMPRQLMPLIVLGFIASSVGSMALRDIGLLPGLSMLASPFLGDTIFHPVGPGFSTHQAYPVALSANLLFTALFFMGSCRRYRGTYASTFNIPQAMALGLVWALLSAISIKYWSTFNPMAFGGRFRAPPSPVGLPAQVVAALCIASLLAIIPMHALMAYQKRKNLPMAVVVAVVLGSVLIALINVLPYHPAVSPMAAVPPMILNPGVEVPVMPVHLTLMHMTAVTALILAAHVFTMYQAFRATQKLSPMSTGIFACALLFVVWVVPLLLEMIRYILTPMVDRPETHFSVLGSLSPLGLLLSQWNMDEPVTAIPGLVFQGIVAIGVWQLAKRMNRTKPAAALTPGT